MGHVIVSSGIWVLAAQRLCMGTVRRAEAVGSSMPALALWQGRSACSGHLGTGRPSGPAVCPHPHHLATFVPGVLPQSPAPSPWPCPVLCATLVLCPC